MTFLQINIIAAIMIMFLIIIRKASIKYLPRTFFILLWDLMLIRLFLPGSINIGHMYGVEKLLLKVEGQPADVGSMETVVQRVTAPGTNNIGLLLWGIGGLCVAIYFLKDYIEEYQVVKQSVKISAEHLKKMGLDLPKLRHIEYRITGKTEIPFVFGVWRPRIILPECYELWEEEDLRLMLLHEYVHIKRFDLIRKWVLAVMLIFYWMNPMIYVLYSLYSRDIEIVCDEQVIKYTGQYKKKHYAKLLISMTQGHSIRYIFLSGFGTNSVKERVEAILKCRKTKRGMTGFIAALFLSTFLSFVVYDPDTNYVKANEIQIENKDAGEAAKKTAKRMAMKDVNGTENTVKKQKKSNSALDEESEISKLQKTEEKSTEVRSSVEKPEFNGDETPEEFKNKMYQLQEYNLNYYLEGLESNE